MPLRRLLEQPIGDDDQRAAFAVAAAALAIAATLLTLIAGPTADRPAAPAAERPTTPHDGRVAGVDGDDALPAGARHVARRFLSGYLAHLHGRARAREIRGATARLRRRLAARPVRVSPSMRRQRPRVERIDGHRYGHGWLVHAEVAAATVSFSISIVVGDRPVGPVVTRVVED